MKAARDSVLDVLVYLYENYADDEFTDAGNHAALTSELLGAGFPQEEVAHAFAWLTGLVERPQLPLLAGSGAALRVYAAVEQARLPAQARGFLLYLEQLGLLDPAARELAVERLMALEDPPDHDGVKWVLLGVLMGVHAPALAAGGARPADGRCLH